MTTAEQQADPRPDVGYTQEGGGTICRCTACGWERWEPTRKAAEDAAADHKKCREVDLALHARRQRARSRR